MTGTDDNHAAAPDADEVVSGIEAAVAELTGPAGVAEQPLTDAVNQLTQLHQLLQGALTSLDRA